MASGIYAIMNMVTEKWYIGSALNIKRRWNEHKCELRRNKHSNAYLQSSWNKHKEINFYFFVLEYTSISFLLSREQHWIDITEVIKNGYNLIPIAGSSLGFKHSPETKEKLRLLSLGNSFAKGRKNTHEQTENMITKLRKTFSSLEIRKVRSERMIGNKNTLGYKHTAETKAKMSAASLGKKKSKTHCINIKNGALLREEQKRNLPSLPYIKPDWLIKYENKV